MIITVHGLEIELLKNNRKYFFVYIWAQFFQIFYGFIYTIYIISMVGMKTFTNYLLVLCLIIEIFFTLMLSSLLIFHTYLLVNNATTWEALSWNSISYLNVWPKKYGSPFNKGLKQNIKMYFCTHPGSKIHIWKMPKKLPTFEQGEKIIASRKWSSMLENMCIK